MTFWSCVQLASICLSRSLWTSVISCVSRCAWRHTVSLSPTRNIRLSIHSTLTYVRLVCARVYFADNFVITPIIKINDFGHPAICMAFLRPRFNWLRHCYTPRSASTTVKQSQFWKIFNHKEILIVSENIVWLLFCTIRTRFTLVFKSVVHHWRVSHLWRHFRRSVYTMLYSWHFVVMDTMTSHPVGNHVTCYRRRRRSRSRGSLLLLLWRHWSSWQPCTLLRACTWVRRRRHHGNGALRRQLGCTADITAGDKTRNCQLYLYGSCFKHTRNTSWWSG